MKRRQGEVKFFDRDKGFGFVVCGGMDYFVHVTSVRGEECLVDGESVEFRPAKGREGREALDVERLDPPEMSVERGVVERWDAEKGYGFVTRPERGDVFAHASDVSGDGELDEGVRIEYRVESGRDGRSRAHDIRVLED